MTKEELAGLLNNREIGSEATPEIESIAKENNLIIIYGASDDLIEVRGAIRSEGDCYGGGKFFISREGIFTHDWEDFKLEDPEQEDIEKYLRAKEKGNIIEAVWDKDEISWSYKTDIPHATFDILEDDEVYCRGIVF